LRARFFEREGNCNRSSRGAEGERRFVFSTLFLSLSQFISLQFLENEKASWKTLGEEKHLTE
jgi:hypothetical protein